MKAVFATTRWYAVLTKLRGQRRMCPPPSPKLQSISTVCWRITIAHDKCRLEFRPARPRFLQA